MDLRTRLLEVKRDEIIRVAGQMFFEAGYTQTSMEDIASRLGVGKPLIYACFKSKADLLAEICNRTTAYAAALAKEARRRDDAPTARVAHIVKELCLRVIEGQMHLAVLFRETKHLPPDAVNELANNFHEFNRSLKALLQEGVDTGEFTVDNFEIVTHAISGLATWIYAWYRPDGPLKPEQIGEKMAELAVVMVARRGKRPSNTRRRPRKALGKSANG